MARVVALLVVSLLAAACATPGGYSGVPDEIRALAESLQQLPLR